MIYTQEVTVLSVDLPNGFGSFIRFAPEGGVRAEVDFNQNGEQSGVALFVTGHNKKGQQSEVRVKTGGFLWVALDQALENEGVYQAAYRRLRATNTEFDQSVGRPSDAA